MTKTPTRKPNRHQFRFKPEGGGAIIKCWAIVRNAKKNVELLLTSAHVLRSIKLQGQGNTQKCAMAICSKEHGSSFPHPVLYIDWLDSKAFVVTKLKDGLPCECVAYDHNDIVAKQFDTKTGLETLLASLEKRGSKKITLYIPAKREKQFGTSRRSNHTGERSEGHVIKSHGARLRFARLNLGGVS